MHILTPTLSRPFGVQLWPHFSRAFTALSGKSPADFQLVPGETPMTTLQGTLLSLATYYIVVLGGRQLMKNQAPFKLRTPFIIHNFVLTVISGVLLALFLEQILPTLSNNGVLHAICDARGGWTDELVLLYYVRLTPAKKGQRKIKAGLC
jgi:fatty acid elongase 2/fatty acid elongase 3